jgi:hypothetical protein
MKNYIFILALAILSACTKDAPAPAPTPEPDPEVPTYLIEPGKARAKRNGILQDLPMKVNKNGYFPSELSLWYNIYPRLSLSELLQIGRIPRDTGRYKIDEKLPWEPLYAKISWTYELDVALGYLSPDTTYDNNYIHIVRLDTLKKEIEGRFEVKLCGRLFNEALLRSLGVTDSDTIHFTEGVFNLKIE